MSKQVKKEKRKAKVKRQKQSRQGKVYQFAYSLARSKVSSHFRDDGVGVLEIPIMDLEQGVLL